MTALLALDALAVHAAGRDLVRGLTLEVRPGEVWAIVGPNGAGKTMLLRTLAGLRAPHAGTVSWSGRPAASHDVVRAAAARAYLPQALHDAFSAPVLDVVLLGAHARQGAWTWNSREDVAQARAALAAVDAAHLAERDVRALSGGERQRVALATVLLQEAPLLLLDEPVAHLDLAHRIGILEHVAGLAAARGKAAVLSIHELDLAARYATHALLFRGAGRVVAGPVDEVLRDDDVSGAFGHPIRRAVVEGRTVFLPA